jgi:hypothetical protein
LRPTKTSEARPHIIKIDISYLELGRSFRKVTPG